MDITLHTTNLKQFRTSLYQNINNRADSLMDLLDAVCSVPNARSVVEYCLAACYPRSYSTIFKAIDENTDEEVINRLKEHYYEIKAGIGLYKSPELYGAFPTDAYSHTPSNAGAKQPGLTGQVKEDVISRFGELGIRIKNGKIHFDISLLNDEEMLTEDSSFEYINLECKTEVLNLK